MTTVRVGRRRLPAWVTRLIGCLAGSLVLALMVGSQEGSQNDYGLAVRQSWSAPRVFIFLAIGVGVFLAITYAPLVRPYLTRPGAWPLIAGVLTVVAAQTVLHWYDPQTAKFDGLAKLVASTPGISGLASAFFAWLAWVQLGVVAGLTAVAVIARLRAVAFAAAGLSIVAAIIVYIAHHDVISFSGQIDHSYGALVAMFGYVVIAAAALAAALSVDQVAHTRRFVNRVLGWRPGLPLVVLGLIVSIYAFTTATWFSPTRLNATMSDSHDRFQGTGVSNLALDYLGWLSWVLLAVSVIIAGVACWFRSRPLGWLGAAVGTAAVVLTLVTIYDMSKTGADLHVDNATGPWQNLGTGAWLACAGFFFVAAGALVAATARRGRQVTGDVHVVEDAATGDARYLTAPGAATTALLFGLAIALFYPPTATPFWQTVLVTEIGIYVLLAVGLNVVVGWAGLLDLGYIAFYAIGSYTTAYLVGSLPVKPPSWLHMSPLWAIPFAIAVCLIAGLLLGAPTLRLRGDYLAIVTLGFGEIVRIVAVNADNVTNGTRGPSPAVPHPVLHIGPLRITWGLNQLQYWYLLLIVTVIVVLAFRRLEDSRLGRAWAAIREDEVAAQATGINTVRVKLLAFAIGASTSGLAGVLFASNVGFFTPDNFVLNNSILVVAYVVFGGMGSLPGVMAGAALLTWLPEFLKDQVPAPDRQMWIGALLLIMMIFRPGGLIPAKRRQAELTGIGATPRAEVTAVPAGEGMGAVVR